MRYQLGFSLTRLAWLSIRAIGCGALKALISVVIPTFNAEARLPVCLEALVVPAIDALVKEVIIVDGGSSDKTVEIADAFGARIFTETRGRGGQLRRGASEARGEWFLFLHADTVLSADWAEAASRFIAEDPRKVGVFKLKFDANRLAAKIVAWGAMMRVRVLKLPYGDQGVLISRPFFEEIGGYADLPVMEDVEFMRRLIKAEGRKVLEVLPAYAQTSAEKYERNGYPAQVVSNAICLSRYFLGGNPKDIDERYRAR